MLGMRPGIWIVMVAGSGKIFRTITVFMNVEGIETSASGIRNSRKVEDLGFNKDSAVGGLIEFYQSADLRISRTTLKPGNGLRAILLEKMDKGETGSRMWIRHSGSFSFTGLYCNICGSAQAFPHLLE